MISTRGLEAFKACLSETDRNYLIGQERLRTQNQQQPLTLHKSAELLTTRYAEAQQLKPVPAEPVFRTNCEASEDQVEQDERDAREQDDGTAAGPVARAAHHRALNAAATCARDGPG